MKGSRLALLGLIGLALAGCGTLKGADDALMNLVGPSTQSRFTGPYIANAAVQPYYKLDAQRQSQQRLSYDGHAVPADETRKENLVDIPMLQTYLQSIVVRLSKGWPGHCPPCRSRSLTAMHSVRPLTPMAICWSLWACSKTSKARTRSQPCWATK